MARRLTTKDKIKSLLRVTSSAATIFTGVCLYQGNERFYDEIAMPLIRLSDPEVAHKFAINAIQWGFRGAPKLEDSTILKSSLWGIDFENPLGMAAGFDKQGEAVKGLHEMGFSFVEIGSITPKPQPGNPKPRVFRLKEDNAIINRYGFNSDGHESVWKRLKAVRNDPHFVGVIGVNLGKNKLSVDPTKDYTDGIEKFNDVADYFVINVSSPNTPGLRDLQNKKNLEHLLIKVNETRQSLHRKIPLLLKLAPDLTDSERQDVADVVQNSKSKVDGLIISNTTIERKNLKTLHQGETGGLSGAPLTEISTMMIADMYKRTHGSIPIIGVGGIFSGSDAYDKIKAGASLIQIYTSFIYQGPPVISRIKRELSELIEKDGFTCISDAIGKNSSIKQILK
ncbi:dihydroorotate dehydrogenase (quinone), mitochondrial isoform X2 [Cephus cinctus]|uniref:Dihydroorotate dehydrogenase (quinone), mitochondrial n=1 Tax=Cephus cinctus TaxID=211228 RepID=A0AAJ7FSQ2_CEPCN|nr:dihydroorotate dehydrogenase (quinone), mitochondrial isoform X2 [Cephus cinctus]